MPNDTYKRLQVRVQAAIQNTSTSTSSANDILPKVKDWIRYRYNRIARGYNWPELVRSYTFTLTASTQDYALRRDVDKVIKVWDQTNGREIIEVDVPYQSRFVSPDNEVSGNVTEGQPRTYHAIGEKSVVQLMSAADTINVVSTSASDVSPVVLRVYGLVSGIETAESITLTGASAAPSLNTYDSGSELRLSLGTSDGTLQDTVGNVTVTETTSGDTLATFGAGERSFLYRWVSIFPKPPSSGTQATLEVWYKKRLRPLSNDNDIPEVECADEIIEGVIADALYEDGQESAATLQEQKFTQLVNELWNAKSKKPNLVKQFVPDNEDTEVRKNIRLFWS